MTSVAWLPECVIDIAEWKSTGRRLGTVARGTQWWIGDWVRYGTSMWGERYAEAAKITRYDVRSLRNMAYVASRFDPSRRRDDLSWSHHAALAALGPAQQDDWLDRASKERMSVDDLRVELRAVERARRGEAQREAATDRTAVVCPHCGGILDAAVEGSAR